MINNDNFFSFDFYLHGIDSDLIQISEIMQLKEQLISGIRTIEWDELIVEDTSDVGSNTRSYTVRLSKDLAKIANLIEAKIDVLQHLKSVGAEILFQGDFSNLACPIQINTFTNRIHITGDGIARSIRGLGLGPKIYRSILTKEEYVTSDPHELYDFGKLLWNSLRKNKLFYTFYTKRKGYCFASDKDPDEIIAVLKEKIRPEFESELLWDSDFKDLYLKKIESSSLLVYL